MSAVCTLPPGCDRIGAPDTRAPLGRGERIPGDARRPRVARTPPGYLPVMRILVLGAGFGGLELAATLSDELGDDLDLLLIDQGEGFVFGFSKLDVMFGKTVPEGVLHPYRHIDKPGVRFVQTSIRSIDPSAKRVETDAGSFDADVIVVALGADLDPSATPGLVAGGKSSPHWPARSRCATCWPTSPAATSSWG
jgi:thioredoxin reductase